MTLIVDLDSLNDVLDYVKNNKLPKFQNVKVNTSIGTFSLLEFDRSVCLVSSTSIIVEKNEPIINVKCIKENYKQLKRIKDWVDDLSSDITYDTHYDITEVHKTLVSKDVVLEVLNAYECVFDFEEFENSKSLCSRFEHNDKNFKIDKMDGAFNILVFYKVNEECFTTRKYDDFLNNLKSQNLPEDFISNVEQTFKNEDFKMINYKFTNHEITVIKEFSKLAIIKELYIDFNEVYGDVND